jgi:hypothetical protein
VKDESQSANGPKNENAPRFYLRADRLKPGDVLLTHGGDGDAKLIATLACGAYSHAALIFGQLLYESDGESWIGYKNLPLVFAKINGEQVMLEEVLGNPTRCCVLRHRDMALVEEAKLQQALDALCIETQGRDYSEWRELLPMLRLARRLLMPIASRIAKRRDLRRSKAGFYLPGAFCSKVVVSFFEKLGLDIGRTDKNLTAPHDLLQPTLRFDVVDSVVIERSSVGEISQNETLLQTEDGLKSMRDMIDDGVKSTGEVARVGQMFLEARSKLNRLRQLQEEARAHFKNAAGLRPEGPSSARTDQTESETS